MAEQPFDHPNPARLAAFGHGTLDHDELAEVESHLAVCESCRQVLSTLPNDKIVGLLRSAQNQLDLAASLRSAAESRATPSGTLDVPDFDDASSLAPPRSHSSSKLGATLSAGNLDSSEAFEPHPEGELSAELADHPRYRIVKRLGSGGMGTVYLAEHRLMDRLVALKVIRHDLLGNELLVERFRREVKAAARLALHPNIVAAYDAEQAGDSHFLVMEFVEGVDLAHLVKRQGPLPFALACQAVKQAAEGLEHAFQRGMVHRDIKPQNLMRTPDGQVKILDFGLARFASEAVSELVPAERETNSGTEAKAHDSSAPITLTDMVLGTADYIAPEQATSPRSADIRADVYSLGCTLYYLLTGRTPFPEGSLIQKLKAHSEQVPRPLLEFRPDVPTKLARIVDRMMAKERSLRFPRPSDVALALAPFANALAANVDARVVATPTALADVQDNQPLPHPSVKTETSSRVARVRLLALIALIVGSVGLCWAAPALWPAAALLFLLIGFAGFFAMKAACRPVIGLFSLLTGVMGFLCLEAPGWPWTAQFSLLICCLRALRMITARQLSFALLSLLIGYAGFFEMEAGQPRAAFISLLVGLAGPLAVIILRHLDLMTLTRKLRAWACVAMFFAVCGAGVAFACGYHIYTKVHGEGILLINSSFPAAKESLFPVRANSTGRLAALEVNEGDRVEPGDRIGEISQDDLRDTISGAQAKLNDLERLDEELSQLEQKQQENDEAAMHRLKPAVNQPQTNRSENTKTAQRTEELQKEQTNAEISRRRARLERRTEIRALQTKLTLDLEKLKRISSITSKVSGRVALVLTARGELVHEGEPVVLLHVARAQRRRDDRHMPPYDAILFIPAGDGKKVEVGNSVQIVPATVDRSEHGFILGHVLSRGEHPATKLALEDALGRPELADAFLEWHPREGLLRVEVGLETGYIPSTRKESVQWSTPDGHMEFNTGTMCQAKIVSQRKRMITLINPWAHRLVGP
jgi:serine/threonine protein kinase/biotin carboxyl carrier protein